MCSPSGKLDGRGIFKYLIDLGRDDAGCNLLLVHIQPATAFVHHILLILVFIL